MQEAIFNWIGGSRVEVLGAVLGLAYIFLSIRQNILTWPVGLLTSALYIYVFFEAKFYADMSLQVYYVGISIYGWYYWIKGRSEQKHRVPVIKTSPALWLPLAAVSVLFFVCIAFILICYTDSPIPGWDAFTTALSLTATWMLARKYLEHWLIWIVVDLVSAVLYATRNLWATAVLFSVYTGMAFIGYLQWKKALKTG
ncbi:MAG: nicotinamide riboside transporter PnuC [Prolixibacteraceae bacterium]